MFLIVLASAVIELIIIFKIYPIRKALKRGMIYIDMLILIAGYICYIIKTGGHRASMMDLLMFSSSLTRYINNLSISYTSLYSIIQISRLIFPYLILYIVVDEMVITSRLLTQYRLKILLSIPMIFLEILGFTFIYTSLFRGHIKLQIVYQFIVLTYMFSYSILSIALMIREVSLTTLSWYRRQNTYLLVSLISIIGIYYLFSLMDPVLLLQDYQTIIVGPYSYYINYKMDNMRLYLFSTLMLISVITNTIAVYKDARIELDRNNQDIKISTTVKETEIFTRGLLHGLKNRILTEKVQTLDILDMIKQNKSIDDIKIALEELFSEQDKTYQHLDMVNKALKEIETHLIIENAEAFFIDTKEICEKKYPNKDIEILITPGVILADKQLLQEALINLVDNAIDAHATKVSIKTEITRVYYLITVADNGSGMSRDVKKKIFLPFNTTKNMRENWGVGLCFTRQVIKKHLGDIQFKSKENEGTIFYITLPRIY